MFLRAHPHTAEYCICKLCFHQGFRVEDGQRSALTSHSRKAIGKAIGKATGKATMKATHRCLADC